MRQRRWLVEGVEAAARLGEATLVHAACVDDDAQAELVSVLWEHELEARVIDDAGWKRVGEQRFDDPDLFAAYARTVRWGCVTATDPNLLQAPFRAGIRLDPYQLEPLRKALLLPRVNLLIADDVVRKALLYYALKRLGLDTDPAARRPQDQQIVLLNRGLEFAAVGAAAVEG